MNRQHHKIYYENYQKQTSSYKKLFKIKLLNCKLKKKNIKNWKIK